MWLVRLEEAVAVSDLDAALRGRMKPPEDSGQILSTLALISQLGFIMVACVLGGYLGGRYLDGVLGTTPVLTILLLLSGIGGGMVSIYRLVMKTIADEGSPD
jgi:F0F1-type ATP synthase assembly protein I